MYKGWIAPKRQGTHGGRMMGGFGSEWVGNVLCFQSVLVCDFKMRDLKIAKLKCMIWKNDF